MPFATVGVVPSAGVFVTFLTTTTAAGTSTGASLPISSTTDIGNSSVALGAPPTPASTESAPPADAPSQPNAVVTLAVGVSIGALSVVAAGVVGVLLIRKRRREAPARAESPPPSHGGPEMDDDPFAPSPAYLQPGLSPQPPPMAVAGSDGCLVGGYEAPYREAELPHPAARRVRTCLELPG